MKRIVSLLLFILLAGTFAFSDSIPISYVLHISSDTFPDGEGNIPVIYSGDYSGEQRTPFDIGPYTMPFTVTLRAPEGVSISGSSNTLMSWLVDGKPRYPSPITTMTVSTDLNSNNVDIIIQYAHVEPTPHYKGTVWIEPPEKTVGTSEDFPLEIHLNTENAMIGAYGFELAWIMPQEGAIIYVNTDCGNDGVEAGPDGFVSAVNANEPGTLTISGFDTAGGGPGTDLHFLTVHFTSGPQAGSTPVDIIVDTIVDENAKDFGIPDTIGATVSVGDIITGDVNSDGAVDIIDALLTAQYYVGLNPVSFDSVKADANCDGSIDIVDALLIAQYYVGLILCLCV